jgi:spore photoproduct lyase
MTQQIVARFKQAKVIEINHYKDVFSRSRQSFQLQKKAMKLILAQKTSPFLYSGADVSQDFGNEHFYYTSSILNCLYNCEYCFLQGMFPSGHIVLFVNIEDYVAEVKAKLAQHPLYLCLSYESDLLALESIAPFASKWLHFAATEPSLTVELRTKSANFKSIQHITPKQNLILAWTLSPDQVIQFYEHDTPSLSARLKAIKEAVDMGWQVRLSFDPILHIPDWEMHYANLIKQTFEAIPADKVVDISIGVFRISKDYLKKMRKDQQASALLHYPYKLKDGVYTYPSDLQRKLTDYVYGLVNQHLSQEQIYIW